MTAPSSEPCAYRYVWAKGNPRTLPCFWREHEHPKRSGHPFQPAPVAR